MSDPTHVYGECQYLGDFQKVERILEEWGGFIGLLIPLENNVFVLDGPYHPCGEGPHGPVQEEDLQDCLNEIAKAVKILHAEFRCNGPESGQAWDLVYTAKRFIRVPLELQPTLEALDDPVVRDHYGLDYCVAQSN